ncbi:MAG: BON domain-containing protein [Sandaracinaceae bacterium]|nr:BON domain-containing protein [Sandaracinaceae bacterium]
MNKISLIFGAALTLAACGGANENAEATTPTNEEAREARPRRARQVTRDVERESPAEDGGEVTAQDQAEAPDDVEITRQIRELVMADGRLSFTAKNCVIVTQNAVVTLRGSVPSAEEKTALETDVRRVDGVRSVDNQLVVNP